MFQIVLFEPEIPPNTGNIIRLCANTGCRLHLIKPLGFDLSHRRLIRAGLDYHEFADVQTHDSWEDWLAGQGEGRVLAFTTKARNGCHQFRFEAGDALLFGPETRGLPDQMLASLDPAHLLRLPMMPGNRSLNLSNAVAVAVYEAWRQAGFRGAAPV
jgi:tRNA (cytidine/uridine-2'-O-)-methyltransferase